jgi:tRNA dimethylallyltransferase
MSTARGGRPPFLLILGPTASGKTDASLVVADALGAEIVVADSRQLYRGLDAGTGKPDAAARARIPHHLLDVLEPDALADAAAYARAARGALEAIERRGRAALAVGGSGLYVRALVHGLFEGPGRDAAFRDALATRAARDGWPALHAELAMRDGEAAARIHANDAVRITRALEIIAATGLPATDARRRFATPPLGRPHRAFAIAWPRAALDARIARRFETMLAAGLVAEVETLLARGVPYDAPSLRSPGYAQVVRHLRGELALEDAAALAVRATRRYAKRQMTWFRAMSHLVWVDGREDAADTGRAILERLRALPA